MTSLVTPSPQRKLAINRLRERRSLDAAAIDRFLARHQVPIVEGARCTFLYRGDADEVALVHRTVGLPERIPLRRLADTDLWYIVVELPEQSRIEYQLEAARDGNQWRMNDPLNSRRAHSPVGSSASCSPPATTTRSGPSPTRRPGRAARRAHRAEPGAAAGVPAVTLYLPARFRRPRYPLLVVHDGRDYLQYAAAKTVLDNLLHRPDVAELVAAFLHRGERTVEYADSTAHARFVSDELLPHLEDDSRWSVSRPAVPDGSLVRGGRGALNRVPVPATYGSLLLQSGSFVFTDIGCDHGGGPVFDPVVKFINRYRAQPRRWRTSSSSAAASTSR